MGTASSRTYAGQDAAARAADRRARLVAAGLDLLGTGGPQAASVRKVCEAARLTPRYFYESFPDLDALTVAVFDAVVAELIERGQAALAAAPADPRGRVRAALGSVIDLVGDDPRKGRVVLTVPLASPALSRRRLTAARRIADLVADRSRDGFGAAVTARQRDLVARFLVGGVAETISAWLQDPDSSSRERLLDDCTELFLAVSATARRLAP
ncbi:TetR/AcrR family transcriptional regulator [Actinomadura atramentaria]|uniref:TetR/AcrR family transcriptional regulator n=1 Tax=Actinomadura atramentaria TaxID=1990 RepID=UPI00036D200C|nr:TetR family transcriptional regulator [Actinomadura atramentaria]